MKIVSWNCNGALRKKLEYVNFLDFDILIAQECEDPKQSQDEKYRQWANNFIWTGKNKNKGIGIFAQSKIKLTPLRWDDDYAELFLPCRVDDVFNLIGVWTKYANSRKYQYIGQFWKYLQRNKTNFSASEILIAGDFNSNVCWDIQSREWNHSDVVKELDDLNIQSLYHLQANETQGEESSPTFFMQRNINKPYHIDYFFASPLFYTNEYSLDILDSNIWLEQSDHVPIVFEIKGH
jgi:exonuclease III